MSQLAADQKQTPLDPIEIGRMPRIASSFVSAVILSVWITPIVSFAWFFTIVVWELAISPRLYEVVKKFEADRKIEDERYQTLIIFTGALCYVWGWALAWHVGGETASFAAGLWFAGSLVHGLIYFSERREQFVACCAPSIFVALVMPWLTQPLLMAASISLISAFLLLTILRGVRDRNRLITDAVASAAAKEAAERANEQKSQFLASMSHELRTPLTAVIGYAELIEDEAQSEGRDATAADAVRISAAARHLLGLVNEILDLAKIEAGRMEVSSAPVSLPSLMGEVAEMLRPLATRNHNTLSIDYSDADATILSDHGKLKQCLLNLGGNACKFTENGSVRIVARLEPGEAGPMLRVDVTDTGPGIAPEAAARLFQPFVQADSSLTGRPDGTGLGLVITRRLADLLGGTVTLETAPGRGSTFTLRVAAPAANVARAELQAA